jgi:hypothetical protein
MTSYRIFYFDRLDSLFSTVDREFASDTEARAHVASTLPDGESGEIWCGARCLGRSGPEVDGGA